MSTPNHQDRLILLETAVAHLQHDYEQLHGVALELQGELRQLILRLERIERQLERLEDPPELRAPADERPPHY